MNIEKDVHIVNSNFKFDFSILHCGIETETANFQPTIFDRFVFNYVLEGRGEIVINDKAFPFAKGDVFIIPEKTLFYQVNSKEDPYKYLYLAIKGDVASVHERATLTAQNPVLHGAGERVREIMFQIFHELGNSSFISIARANALYIDILLYLYEKNPKNSVTHNSPARLYAKQALLYIEQNYYNKITVAQISKSLHVNRSYLSFVFKKEFGITIKEYITKERVDKARFLIQNTQSTINNIMYATGFTDYANFYKAFKQHTGISPREYRKTHVLPLAKKP